MAYWKSSLYILCLLILTTGCKGKKKKVTLSGDEPVEVSDFIGSFPDLSLPYVLGDSSLLKKEKDSSLISYKVFTQFVPDSILVPVFGKNKKLRIYPVGKAMVPDGETYLFSRITGNEKKAIYILAFDKKEQFITGLPALKPAGSPIMQTVTLDRRLTLTRSMIRKNPDGTFSEGKEVYVLNADARNFTLIMTEALDDKLTEVINPIDTLQRKHKYAADYTNGKMNLVSIRDNKKADRLTFYIHFEKNNGECTGELRGEALLKTANTAEYRVDGDPCILKFTFSSNSVSLKEIDGCGSRRGLRCSFDGSYSKKKVIKPKTK